MEKKEKILLVTKNYPPQIGGIEIYSENLYNSLKLSGHEVYLIKASARNQKLLGLQEKNGVYNFIYLLSEFIRLFIFFIKSFTVGLYYSYKVDIVWCMDGSLGGIGYLLGILNQKKTRITLHGKDVTWNFFGYQRYLFFCLNRLSEIFVVSEILAEKIVKKVKNGQEKIQVIPHKIEQFNFIKAQNSFSKKEFCKKYKISENVILLFSLGRFVEKKGFHWFIEEVMAKLDPKKYLYILAGFGPLEKKYREILKKTGQKNVKIIGPITDPQKKANIYSCMDYFIMPNIETKNDTEGFGIVLLEASFYKLKIISSDADGLANRVMKKSDIILSANKSGAWIECIKKII